MIKFLQTKTSKDHVTSKRKSEIDTKIPYVCNLNSIYKGSFSTDLQQKYKKKHAQKHWRVIKQPSIPNHIWVQGSYIVAHLFCGGGYCGYEILEHFASS